VEINALTIGAAYVVINYIVVGIVVGSLLYELMKEVRKKKAYSGVDWRTHAPSRWEMPALITAFALSPISLPASFLLLLFLLEYAPG